MRRRFRQNSERYRLERFEAQIKAILTYHSIDSSGSPISMPQDQLARQLDWMGSGKVRVLSPRELVESPDDTDAIAVTFDDGFVNFGEVAAPLLAERRVSATVFVSPHHVGRTNAWDADKRDLIPEMPLLGWEELRRLSAQRIDIGGHGQTHRSLKGLDQGSLEYEVTECATIIEASIGKPSEAFAFPYGDFDEKACAEVAKKFKLACTTEMRVLSRTDSVNALPRIDMYYFREKSIGAMWGTQSFGIYVKARASLRSIKGLASRGKNSAK